MTSNSSAVTSAGNHSNQPSEFVGIITWFLLVVSGLAVFARLATKYAVFKRLAYDDGLSVISLVCNIGAGLSVTRLCHFGLGENIVDLNKEQLTKLEQGLYALGILYITTLCFAKLSIIMLLRTISPDLLHQRLGLYLGAFIAVWGVVSVLVSALQCSPPRVWATENNQCINRTIFWHAVGAMNLVSDAMLVLLPFHIFRGLNMSMARKITVMGCFGARSVDIIATAFQLAYTSSFSSAEITTHIWPWILIAQIIQTITIITSCIPYLHPLLKSYPSGMYSIHDSNSRKPLGYSRRLNYNNYALRDTNQGVSSTSTPPRTVKEVDDYAFLESRGIGAKSEIETVPADKRSNKSRTWDASSQRSQSRIIKATTTIETSWQYRQTR